MVNSCKCNINNSILVERCVADTNYYVEMHISWLMIHEGLHICLKGQKLVFTI